MIFSSALLASVYVSACGGPVRTPPPEGEGAMVPTDVPGCVGTAEWALAECRIRSDRVLALEANHTKWDALRSEVEADREMGWLYYDVGFETYVLVSARSFRYGFDADLITGITDEQTEVFIDVTPFGIEVRRPSDERLLYFASNLEPFSRRVRPDALDAGPLSFDVVAGCTKAPLIFGCEVEEGPRNGAMYDLVAVSDTGPVTIDYDEIGDVIVEGRTYRVRNIQIYEEHRPSGTCGDYCTSVPQPKFELDFWLVEE
jgi:hypothetical protein